MLREIKFNGLDNARPEGDSPCSGIEPLDELLRLFRSSPAVQQQHENPPLEEEESYEGDHEEHISSGRPLRTVQLQRREPIIEITSPGSGDGKTSLLYYITAVGILPSSLEGIQLGGKESAVVFLDTDFRFDAARLREVLVGITREKLHAHYTQHDIAQSNIKKALELMIDECLRHVHIFRPHSSSSLLATLRTLESYVLHSTEHLSHARRLHAIILDSASAFYWQDRREAEILNIPGVREERAAQQTPGSTSPSDLENLSISQVAQETILSLRHLQRVFSCVIAFTTWGLQRALPQRYGQDPHSYSHSLPNPLSFRPHLPWPWLTFPTLRLVVSRDTVRASAPFMTVGEEGLDAPSRQAIVARGEFSAWVDMWARESWATGVAERVMAKGGFGFWVRDSTVGGFTYTTGG